MELCHHNFVGELVYVRDDQYEWLPAVVVANGSPDRDLVQVQIDLPANWESTTVLKVENDREKLHGCTRWVPLDDYYNHTLPLRQPQANLVVRDLADLVHLHEAAVLYQIKQRHATYKLYTRVGDIIVAVNPCRWIPELYSLEVQREYALNLVWQVAPEKEAMSSPSEEKKDDRTPATAIDADGRVYERLGYEPHVYEVSALAYRGLASDHKDQTILVPGESGAGKTETVKIVLQHLARLPKWRPDCDGYNNEQTTDDMLSQRLVEQIIEGLPIFEAFGNARTCRNHNSSRFGKVTRLHFSLDSHNHVCVLQGTKTDTYLLETSRVASHSDQERNFHIFYQLLAAPEQVKRELLGEEWKEAKSDDFRYLHTNNASSSTHMPTSQSDSDLWVKTEEALRFFGWRGKKLKMLVRALGIVLRLGNLTFEETTGKGATVASPNELRLLAQELDIPISELERGVTFRKVKTAQEEIQVPYSAEQAKDACDVLAKTIYSRIFSMVVNQINQQTTVPRDENNYSVISLVDIFGFESFETNRFEQLCVNYTSEKLQHKYIHDNLRCRVAEYEQEGIEVFDFKSLDNSHTIELFEGPNGLIESLNEECLLPNGCNESFVFKMKSSNKNLLVHDLQKKTEFGIRHFAGPVMYDAVNFVEKNNEKLPRDLLSLLEGTSNTIIRSEIKNIVQDDEVASEGFKKKITSVLEKFSIQLHSLLTSLTNTQVRYIRCIKPNEDLVVEKTDHQKTLRQLRCAGLVAAVDMSRETFPGKLSFRDAEERFKCLMPSSFLVNTAEMPVHDRVNLMMSMLFTPCVEAYRDSDFAMPYACGKTRVYFRGLKHSGRSTLELLETLRSEYHIKHACKVQQWYRKENGRHKYLKFLGSLIRLQSHYRGHKCKTDFLIQKRGFVRLQAHDRTRRAHVEFDRQRQNAILLQKWIRSYQARETSRTAGAICIQSWYRAANTRSMYLETRKFAVLLQTWGRSVVETRRFASLVRSTVLLQSFFRAALVKRHYEKIHSMIVTLQKRWLTRSDRIAYQQRLHNRTLDWSCASGDYDDFSEIFENCTASLNSRTSPNRKTSMEDDISSVGSLSEVIGTESSPFVQQNDSVFDDSETNEEEDSVERSDGSLVSEGSFSAASGRGIECIQSADIDGSIEVRDTTVSALIVHGDSYCMQDSSDKDPVEIREGLISSGKGNRDMQVDKEEACMKVQEISTGSFPGPNDPGSQHMLLEIEKLKEEIMHITEESEMHKQEIEAEYEDRLTEYEHEVLGLRESIQRCEEEKGTMRRELKVSKENYIKIIKQLQMDIQETRDNHKEYVNKITAVVESVNEARKADAIKFAKEMKRLQLENDTKIKLLENVVHKLNAERDRRQSKSRERLPEEVHRLARKLERLICSENILKIIEDARDQPELQVSLVETAISSKCRRTLYRLEDAVGSVIDPEDRLQTIKDGDAESICLQNQLVKAYEKIEELKLELQFARKAATKRFFR